MLQKKVTFFLGMTENFTMKQFDILPLVFFWPLFKVNFKFNYKFLQVIRRIHHYKG